MICDRDESAIEERAGQAQGERDGRTDGLCSDVRDAHKAGLLCRKHWCRIVEKKGGRGRAGVVVGPFDEPYWVGNDGGIYCLQLSHIGE